MSHPKESKRISELISMPHKGHHIRDYSKIEEIFILYLKEYYDTMAKEIYFYRHFDFFVDLSSYLAMHFIGDARKSFYFMDIIDMYLEREDDVKAILWMRKERKKYGF
jgi:hypothetical protein